MGYHGLGMLEIDRGMREILADIATSYVRGEVGATTAAPNPPEPAPVKNVPSESVGSQIMRLRAECNMTAEELAGAMGMDVRQIYRHQAGETSPRAGNLRAYEKVFSDALHRDVTMKRQPRRT